MANQVLPGREFLWQSTKAYTAFISGKFRRAKEILWHQS